MCMIHIGCGGIGIVGVPLRCLCACRWESGWLRGGRVPRLGGCPVDCPVLIVIRGRGRSVDTIC